MDFGEHEKSHSIPIKGGFVEEGRGKIPAFFAPSHVDGVNREKVITTARHQMAIQKTLNLIQTRIQDPPTLGELASFAGLSRTYFSYVFRQVTGMRLRDYLIQARVNKAKDLLRDFNLQIKEIAYEVGFKDSNHFCRTFKKKVGLGPTTWRLREIKGCRQQLS